MKIGLVSPYDYSYPGGVRDHVAQLAVEFMKRGHKVRILAPASAKGVICDPVPVYKLGSITSIPANGSVARITLSFLLSKQVKQILETERFDVIHLHEPLASTLPLTVLHFSEAINVGTFHAFRQSSLAYKACQPFLQPYFDKLDYCLAVSEVAKRFISHYFPASYQVIPNGIDVQRFQNTVEPFPEYRDGKLNILFVGRMEKRKGLKYLLRAIPAVRARFPHTRFLIVGEGNRRPAFEHWVAEAGLHDVIFTGYVSAEELPRYYASCDVFCAPSTGGESFGIVLLEAMAAARPVVASAIEGYRDVVEQGQEGLLCEPCNPEALATALCTLLSNPRWRWALGERGRRKALAHSWVQMADHILDVYLASLEQRRLAALPRYQLEPSVQP